MSNVERRRTSRREFFRSAGRALVGGTLAVAAGALLARGARAGGDRNSQKCVNLGVCRGCGAFDDCALPAALSAKQAKSTP